MSTLDWMARACSQGRCHVVRLRTYMYRIVGGAMIGLFALTFPLLHAAKPMCLRVATSFPPFTVP